MLRHKILPAILVVLPATTLLTAQASLEEAQAEECRTRPGSPAPRGTHWYYRVNRASNQHCWYLGAREAQLHSQARRAVSYAHRRFGQHGTRALSKRLAQQTASAQMAPVEVAPSEQWASAQTLPIDFASRWLNTPTSTEVREVATIHYTDDYPATDANERRLFPEPVVEAKRTELRPGAGEAAFGSVFLPSALATLVLLLAGGVFKLSRWPLHSHARDQWRASSGPTNFRRHRRVNPRVEAASNSFPAAAQYASDVHKSTPIDPAHDLEAGLQELIADLQRARTARYPMRSFAPPGRTGRTGRVLEQAKA